MLYLLIGFVIVLIFIVAALIMVVGYLVISGHNSSPHISPTPIYVPTEEPETPSASPTETPVQSPVSAVGLVVGGPDSVAGYSFVRAVTLAGSQDGALSDYQVKLVVHKGSGTDSGPDVYLSGHSQSWPNDLRFTNSAGTVLGYWVESCDANTANVWVKVDSIPASPGTATVKLYYGKPGEKSMSDGSATFVAFDDFSNDANRASVWTESASDGIDGFTDVHRFENGGYHIKQNSGDDRAAEIALADKLSVPTRCSVILQDVSHSGSRSPTWLLLRVGYGISHDHEFGYWGETLGSYYLSSGHTYQLLWTDGSNTNNVQIYENSNLIVSESHTDFNTRQPSMGIRTASDAMGEWYFRDFYARAYTAHEPKLGGWGGETTA